MALKRSWIKRGTKGFKPRKTALKRTQLRKVGKSPVSETKQRIQALLRAIVIKRDGGCVLRGYPEAGACGGFGSKSGKMIYQAEHLCSRSNSISFGDLRNVVCLCARHHLYFKPQYSRLYWELIEQHIGAERWQWLKRVEADKKPYRFTEYDWLKVEMGLIAHYETIRGVDTREVMGSK